MFKLLHVSLVEEIAFTRAVGCVNVAELDITHPRKSVTVSTYEPAGRPLIVDEVAKVGFQLYVYGAVPPETVELIDPLLPPKQLTLVEVSVADKGNGWLIV